MRCLAALLVPISALAQDSFPPNWPTNPYWVYDRPPNGPGHKVENYKQLVEKCPKEQIGIKVSVAGSEIGTFEVGDVLRFGSCIGDVKSRIALNHKGASPGGLEKAVLQWMDEKGTRVLDTMEVKGGCG